MLKLLAKRPEDRYQSSSDVLAELRRVQRSVDQGSRVRTRALITVALVVVVAFVAWILPRSVDVRVLQTQLDAACATGRIEDAGALVDEICRRDTPGRCVDAKARLKEATGWAATTDGLADSVLQALLDVDWDTAQGLIAQLEELGRSYSPAFEQATRFQRHLDNALIVADLNRPKIPDPEKAGPSRDEEILTPAGTERPDTDPTEEAAQLARERSLELRNTARPGWSSEQWTSLLRKL